jgi:hypothetical protein
MAIHLISRKTQIQPFGKTGFFHILILESTKISTKNNRSHFARSDGTALAKTMLDLEQMRPFIAGPAGFG